MTKATLEHAASLIEKGWCQGAFAKDKNGKPVVAASPEAVAWCAAGAVMRAMHDKNTWHLSGQIWGAIKSVIGTEQHFSAWGEEKGRQKTDILAVFAAAVSKLQ